MKNIYALVFISLIRLNGFSQTIGITNYPTTITSTTVHANNLTKASAFVIDNNNNKWIGFNAGTTTSFQLLRYNGTQWDTFPAFNAISATNKVNALAVDARVRPEVEQDDIALILRERYRQAAGVEVAVVESDEAGLGAQLGDVDGFLVLGAGDDGQLVLLAAVTQDRLIARRLVRRFLRRRVLGHIALLSPVAPCP